MAYELYLISKSTKCGSRYFRSCYQKNLKGKKVEIERQKNVGKKHGQSKTREMWWFECYIDDELQMIDGPLKKDNTEMRRLNTEINNI